MSGDYVEKITKANVVLRVNFAKGTYLVFKNNKPITDKFKDGRSIIHYVPHVVFVGRDFDLSMNPLDKVGFYEIEKGQMRIPFRVQGLSDVRHLKLPVTVDVDMLPAVVHYSRSATLGILPGIGAGTLHFIVDSNVEQENLVRIKIQFPHSRIVYFRPEKETQAENVATRFADQYSKQRAADVSESRDVGSLSQNPVFSARVYLRQLDWVKMDEVPLRFILDANDAMHILTFLQIMQKNSARDEKLRAHLPHIESLIEHYTVLRPFLSFEVPQVEQFFDQGLPDNNVLKQVRDVLLAQRSLHRGVSDRKKEMFFNNALGMLQTILPD